MWASLPSQRNLTMPPDGIVPRKDPNDGWDLPNPGINPRINPMQERNNVTLPVTGMPSLLQGGSMYGIGGSKPQGGKNG